MCSSWWCAAGPAGLHPCSAQPWGLQGAVGTRWGPLWHQEDPVLICVYWPEACVHTHTASAPALRPPRSSPFHCWNGAAGSLASYLVSGAGPLFCLPGPPSPALAPA